MKRARLIYNPTSGREEMKKNLHKVLAGLEKAGYEASAHATIGAGDATEAAKLASNRGFDLIVAAGGDGTVNEVVSGMMVCEYKPKLAILPMGTSNDFARAIGIPKNLKQALRIIQKSDTQMVDIGKVNDKYFINIAGGGTLTEVTYEVPSKLKTAIGQLAYYIKGIEKLPQFKPFPVRIETEEHNIKEDIMMFLIANSNVVGGFERLAPFARIDDGMFDVFILKKSNIAELARVMTLLNKGEHIKDSKIVHFKTNRLKIHSPQGVQLNLDGEFGGVIPCEFELLKHHIEIIVGNKN